MAGNGLRLLSFDCGGIKSLSQLKIMENIVHRIQYDRDPDDPDVVVLPCECFDAMSGSDTGGLLVIMFCKLRMSVEDTIEEFYKICLQVYVKGISQEERTIRLRECIENLLRRRNLPVDLMMGKDVRVAEQGCPCFVVATPRDNMNKRVNLRSYRTRTQPASKATVVEAILATCATQPDFAPLSIGTTLGKQDLVGGAMSIGNPCRELILEAYDLFGKDSHISTILSIGSGRRGALFVTEANAREEWIKVLQEAVQNCENIDQEIETQVGHLGIYYRLSVEQMAQRMYGLDVKDINWINAQAESYLETPLVSRKIDHCVESLRLRQGQATLEQLKRSHGAPSIYKGIPPLLSYFVLRTGPWEKMVRGLIDANASQNEQRIMVISGMGGCGKTQLVIHFINEYKSRFKRSFFIDGSSRESIQADIINHVRTASSAYSQASFSEAQNFFCNPNNQPSLLVYDNVDDIDLEIVSLLPNCNYGAIIITTRNRSRGQLASPSNLHIELDVMSPEEAIDVFTRSSKLDPTDRNVKSVDTITSELGYLPVALVQAGSYIHENTCPAEEYLERFRNHRSEMMYTPAGDRLQKSSYAAFDVSYDRLPLNVQNFLHLIGCVHFANFPLQIIVEGAKTKFTFEQFQFEDHGGTFNDSVKVLMDTFCPSGQWDNYTLDKMTRTLRNYSMASFTKSGLLNFLQMHPLIHQWSFVRLHPGKRILFRHAAGRLIAASSKDTTLHHYLLPHIDALEAHHSDIPLNTNTRAAFANILVMMERCNDSRAIWEHIYGGLVNNPESSKLHVATAAMELAGTYEHDLSKMEELEKDVIGIRVQLLGPDHLETLDAKMRLAATYERQKKFEESEVLYREILKILELRLGLTHQKVLEVMEWLGQAFYNQHRYSEAETLQKQVLNIRREQIGDTHLSTVTAMSNLGVTYYSQSCYSEAEALQEQVLKIRRELLGVTHLSTVAATSNLGVTYRSQGRHSEAEILQEQVLKIRREQLGNIHIDTIAAMSNLGATYHSQGRYTEAEALDKLVLKMRREQLGNTHLNTIAAMSHLALTYYSQHHYSEAESLQEQVLKMQREQLGYTHLDTVTTMSNLGATYYSLGRYTEAEVLQDQVLKTRREKLGEAHLNTIATMGHLGLTYYSQNRYAEAEALQDQVLKTCRDKLGNAHLDTVTSMNNLGATYYSQWRYAEAETLQEQTLKLRQERLGDTHLDTLLAMNNLGWTCYYLGRLVQAKELATQAEKGGKDSLGVELPYYKNTVKLLRRIDQAEVSSISHTGVKRKRSRSEGSDTVLQNVRRRMDDC